MRKALIGLGFVAIIGLGAGLGADQLTTAQDIAATPNQLLVCGTPIASPEAGATPELLVNGTPVEGVGAVIASPGTDSSGLCETEPSNP